MTEEMKERSLYVELYLGEILGRLDGNVLVTELRVEGADEYVVVTYATKPLSERRVLVTGKSLAAMTVEVVSELLLKGEHHEQ